MSTEIPSSATLIQDTPSLEGLEKSPHTSDGIYVLRTTQQNQVQLNLMSDQKANIIIGVSLIFGTIAQRQIIVGKEDSLTTLAPLAILGITMLASFALAVLVVAPRLRKNSESNPANLSNPLFFGFFPSVNQKDFSSYLVSKLHDPDSARELLIRDLYQTGTVLRRKYRLLRYAYFCLGTGVLVSAITTAIMMMQGLVK